MRAFPTKNGCAAAWKGIESDSLTTAPVLLLNYRDSRTELSQNANRIGSGSLLVIPLACYPSIDRSFYRNKSTFVEGCDQAYERAASVGLAEWIGRDRD